MKTFGPKNYQKRTFEGDSRHNDRFADSPHRDDSGYPTRNDDPASLFTRDKRPRINRPARATDSFKRPQYSENERRKSFNPNFTEDNRPRGGSSRVKPFDRNKKDYTDRYPSPQRNGTTEGRPFGKNEPEKRDDRFRPREKRTTDYKPRTGNSEKYPVGKGRQNDRFGKYDTKRADKNGRKPGKGRPATHENKPGSYPRYEAKQTGEIRLNRFIANSGICSRREADDLITAGLVAVNGTVVTELGSKVRPEDEVRFNGSVIKGEKKVYILMNKPKGFVTSLDDPHADKTVMDLIKGACTERVYPVGRLDKNSVGVLLITNDGELTRKLTHPGYNKRKVYQVSLNKALTQTDMTKIAEGITLEDGPVYADAIEYASENRKEVGIEIHSGRNRIVRRIFESLGYSVQKLDRVYFAGLTKKRLKRGGWRFLTPQEVAMLKSGAYE